MQFDPEQMKPIEEKADSLTEKLKNSPYTALILIVAGIGALLLIVGLAAA